MMKIIPFFLLVLITATGCTTHRSLHNYSYSYTGSLRANETYQGIVIQERPVEIDTATIGPGGLVGAIIGGVVGYNVGDGSTTNVVVGSVLGSILGNQADRDIIEAQELIIRLVDRRSYYYNQVITIVQARDPNITDNTEVFIITSVQNGRTVTKVVPFYDNPTLDLRYRNLDTREVRQTGREY